MGTDPESKDESAVSPDSSTDERPPSDHISNVIAEMHVCYDYCATWKEIEQEREEVNHLGSNEQHEKGSGNRS